MAPFEVIAIIGKPRDQQAIQTHRELYQWLALRVIGRLLMMTRYHFRRYLKEHFSSLIELETYDLFGGLLSVATANTALRRLYFVAFRYFSHRC